MFDFADLAEAALEELDELEELEELEVEDFLEDFWEGSLGSSIKGMSSVMMTSSDFCQRFTNFG